jgi:LPS-assembly lipoprotein
MFLGGWSILSSRRALIALSLPLLAAGCGFRPMHGRSGLREDAQVSEALAAVTVGLITERQGQLMRRRLEEGLAPAGRGAVTAKYDLRVGIAYGFELQGFRRDGFPSRVRFNATANWFLFDVAAPPREVTRGTERATDAYDIPENQFFAADVARETMERQMVEQLAQQILERLAMHFRRAAQGAAPA